MTQITERLFIGEKGDQPFSRFTALLNLAPDLFVLLYEKIEYASVGLIDGPGNKTCMIVAAVSVLHQLLERHPSVVLICHGGTGRSGLVASLYLAVRHDIKWEHALQLVKNKRPQADPNGELIKCVPVVIPLLQKLFKE